MGASIAAEKQARLRACERNKGAHFMAKHLRDTIRYDSLLSYWDKTMPARTPAEPAPSTSARRVPALRAPGRVRRLEERKRGTCSAGSSIPEFNMGSAWKIKNLISPPRNMIIEYPHFLPPRTGVMWVRRGPEACVLALLLQAVTQHASRS
jgi:hypothetical protein